MSSMNSPRPAYEADKRFEAQHSEPSQEHSEDQHTEYGRHWDKRCEEWRSFTTLYFIDPVPNSVDFKYPTSAAISTVLDIVHSALQCREVQVLLAASLDDSEVDPRNISDETMSFYLRDTLHALDRVIEIRVGSLGSPTTYGVTLPCPSPQMPIIRINDLMIKRLQTLDVEKDSTAPFIIALAVTTIFHELAHFVRMAAGRTFITPPQKHVSRFFIKDEANECIVGEVGYVFESLFWGGVVTALSPTESSALFSPQHEIVGIILEQGEPWTVEEYEKQTGPPVLEKFVDVHVLKHAFQQLTPSNDRLTFPLIKDTEIGPVPSQFQGYYRIRGAAQTKLDTAPALFRVGRGHTIRGPGGMISC